MQEATTFFNDSFYQGTSARTQGVEEEGCCPWGEEVQNFRKQPLYRPRQHLARQQRRYTSQLDGYSPKAAAREQPREREAILPFNSVTITYGTDPPAIKQMKQKHSKVRLPSLASRRGSLPVQRSEEGSWGLLGENKRGSLKRYTPKWRHEETPPQFQIYKRSLIAARRFVLNALSNPQATLSQLSNL